MLKDFLTFISIEYKLQQMDVIKFDVYRGPNIGIYINVNDDFVLLPMGFAQNKAEKLENI